MALSGANNDILDDPLLSSPPVSQGEASTSESPETSTPELAAPSTPPPYSPIYPKLPAEEKLSPAGHTQGRASYLPTAPAVPPPREVAGTGGPSQ